MTTTAERNSSANAAELYLPKTRSEALQELELLQAEVMRRQAPARIERSLPPKVLPLLQPARYKGLHGGRGGVKSHTFARMLVAWALRKPGLRFLCAREIQNSLKDSVKRLLEDIIIEFGVGDRFEVLDTKINTPGDGQIIFLGLQSHTVESVKSLEGQHGCWVEEAQSLSKHSLELLRPTIRAEWNENGKLRKSEIWFSWNPVSRKDPVDEFLRGSMPPADAIVIETNWQDNPYFPEVLRADMERDYARDPENASHVWGGNYAVRSNASVFKNWRVFAFETPGDVAYLFGSDWGFAIDPSVLVRGFVPDGNLAAHLKKELGLLGERILCIDDEAYAVGCEIDDTPALFDTIGNGMARGYEIVADSARPETISYMQRHGYPRIVPARKGAGSVEEGVNFLKSYDIVVHPRCAHTIEELTDYKYKTHPLTEEVLPVLEDKKNHVIDATRYMVEKLNKPKYHLTW